MNLEHLGTPTAPLTRVHGGFANPVHRLDTDRGSFAVKELDLVDRLTRRVPLGPSRADR